MSTPLDNARAYSRAHGNAFIDQLLEFLRIPSLSGAQTRRAMLRPRQPGWRKTCAIQDSNMCR